MVHKACLELGLAPNQVTLIGDTNSDMQMGKSAGVAATPILAIYIDVCFIWLQFYPA
ncbi:HAD hydrolase-like protein [Paenibacillus phytorum]|uniref:HAD hydrolase-like protein n=1 Tax=Paenibacillus phytorum TaxID=2654977 RepID=UPI001FEA0E7F|nr:HAD hydrolase-like protein [Paenibacillus phytorum]